MIDSSNGSDSGSGNSFRHLGIIVDTKKGNRYLIRHRDPTASSIEVTNDSTLKERTWDTDEIINVRDFPTIGYLYDNANKGKPNIPLIN